jgi:hypothetical protein
MEVNGQFHALATSSPPPKERDPGTHWIGGWVGHIACLDIVEYKKKISFPFQETNPGYHVAIPTELPKLLGGKSQ